MCIKPLKGVVVGVNESTGKNIIKVVGEKYVFKDSDIVFPIPCGKCIECRLAYSRKWADRMMAEASQWTNNCFLTLTYDDEHLPLPLIREKDGEIQVSPYNPLVKRDVQLFMKRLRKHYPDTKIRFFACGEYGEKSHRPHYHLILFNYQPEDAELFMVKNGFNYYTSPTISKLWTYGIHMVANVSWDTCAYVARYVCKKQHNDLDQDYKELNYPKEFTLMSRKPGIGYQFFEDNISKFIDFDSAYLETDKGARKIMLNDYYAHLFDIEYPEFDYLRRKRVKECALENMKNTIDSSGLCYNQIMENKRETIEARTKHFERSDN